MNSAKLNSHKEISDIDGVRLLSPREILSLELQHIEVPPDTEVRFTPANREYVNCFAQTRLTSYKDLQILGLVPRRLSEEKVRQAIAEDDREVYDLTTKMLQVEKIQCGCNPSIENSSFRRNPVRTMYNDFRKTHNPRLAEVLSDHYSTHITWDEPVPAIVRKWTMYIHFPRSILLAIAGDIIIHRHGILSLASGSKSLMAWNIWIHKTGTIKKGDSYVKILANSINHFEDFLDSIRVDVLRKVNVSWQRED